MIFEVDHIFFVGLDNFVDNYELSIFGHAFANDGSVAVGTGDLCFCVCFEEFLHAWGATIMLIHAHHHWSIVARIEFSKAHKTLLLHFILENTLHFLRDSSAGQYFHGLAIVKITK